MVIQKSFVVKSKIIYDTYLQNELDETEIKLIRNEFIKAKESRTAATFRLYQF